VCGTVSAAERCHHMDILLYFCWGEVREAGPGPGNDLIDQSFEQVLSLSTRGAHDRFGPSCVVDGAADWHSCRAGTHEAMSACHYRVQSVAAMAKEIYKGKWPLWNRQLRGSCPGREAAGKLPVFQNGHV
jgi:hypothetical protein